MNGHTIASACAFAFLLGARISAQSKSGINADVQAAYPRSEALYLDLHQHPELSKHEVETAAKLANEIRQLGYEVTTGVGGTGVVGILKNGAGPTVMLRTELDALPVTENTGLPFASTTRTKDDAGLEVGVMHACGHDIHMAAWMGTARIMAATRGQWRGTLMLIGQPAEEMVSGAKAMIADGLFTRFPRPDFALAVHDDARLPAGIVGYHAGPILTNGDAVNIRIFGRGGHGARPETTVDPIVIAARTVLALQTIVSREVSPFDAAVITVGAIHGGRRAARAADRTGPAGACAGERLGADAARIHCAGSRIGPSASEGHPARNGQRRLLGVSARRRTHPHAAHRRGRTGKVRRGNEIGRVASVAPLLPIRARPGADDQGGNACGGSCSARAHADWPHRRQVSFSRCRAPYSRSDDSSCGST